MCLLLTVGILLLNTVDSLVAVSYQFAAGRSMALDPEGPTGEADTSASPSRELRHSSSSLPATNHTSPPTRGMELGKLSTPPHPTRLFLASGNHDRGCCYSMHTLLINFLVNFFALVLSPGHILQVDVYRGATLLPLVTGPTHHLSDVSGGVSVDQSVLDVELWLNGVLQVQLEKSNLHYRSLMDYDIQLYQVCTQLLTACQCYSMCNTKSK